MSVLPLLTIWILSSDRDSTKRLNLETVRSIVSDMLVESFADGRHCSIG